MNRKRLHLALVFLVSFFVLFLCAQPAAAGEGWSLPVLVVDADKAGTNVRAAPSGKVIFTLPYAEGPRIVRVQEAHGKWFRIEPFEIADFDLENASTVPAGGWMHGSVLALCPCASEDGDPWLYDVPSFDAYTPVKVKDLTPLRPLERRGEWFRVSPLFSKGKSAYWVHEQQVTPSVSALVECQELIVERWKEQEDRP